jgi:hypothetical protein
MQHIISSTSHLHTFAAVLCRGDMLVEVGGSLSHFFSIIFLI